MSTIYRVRGLSVIDTSTSKSKASSDELNPDALLAQLLRSLNRPHITDVLFHTKKLQRLSRYWPTLAYIRPKHRGLAIKDVPFHLYPFIDYSSKDCTSLEITLKGEQQESEENAIESLLGEIEEQGAPALSQSPLATALASAFYRGSPWFAKHKAEILNIILNSTAASYIAILSGVFRGNLARLLENISSDPALVLELSNNPVLVNIATEAWFIDHLRSHPVHLAAKLFLMGKSKEAIAQLQTAAKIDAISAGVCLSLVPHDERAKTWLAAANGSAEAIYWMGRVWRAAGKDVLTHPHLATAHSELRHSPKWNYHFVRDVAPEEALSAVKQLWPTVWGPELIVDLGLSESLVLELYNSQTLDRTDPVESALLIWASNFITPPKS